MKGKLHILFICGWYPSRVLPTNGDFIERHALAIALKHNVTALHIITDANLKAKTEIVTTRKGQLTTHIAYIKKTRNPLNKILLFNNAFFLLLKKVVAFDVIHLNEIYPFGILAMYISKKFNKPLLISEHFTGYLEASPTKIPYFKKQISKLIVRKAFAICPVSKLLSDDMQKSGFKGNFIIVPNVVDTTLFMPKKNKSEHLKLVHISGLNDAHKNISGMLRVAKQLEKHITNFEWIFIGGNGKDYNKTLHDLNIKNGKILFLEHQTQAAVAKQLQKASVCISFSNYETFGIVIPEAIACGTPVITTNTGVALLLENSLFCKVIPTKEEAQLLQEILVLEASFKNINTNKMHNFVEERFSKEVISNKFSFLYYESLKA